MNTSNTSSCTSGTAIQQRVVLNSDHKVCSVALDLVRAAAEYQSRVRRNEATAGIVAEIGERFGIDEHLSEALLAGRVTVEIQGDQLVVPSSVPEGELSNFVSLRGTHGAPHTASPGLDPDERARRMHSVLLTHAAARGVSQQAIGTLQGAIELLCDLRHWCDEHMVDIYKALDQSYIRYMHDKYQGLTSDRH